MAMCRYLAVLPIAFVLLSACDLSRTVAEPISPDGGDTDVDSDTDADSDTDTDVDTDSDGDTDTAVIPMDCADCPSVGADPAAIIVVYYTASIIAFAIQAAIGVLLAGHAARRLRSYVF